MDSVLYGLAKGRCSQRDAMSFGTDKTRLRISETRDVRRLKVRLGHDKIPCIA